MSWKDLASSYCGGRAESTMAQYKRSFRRVWGHSMNIKKSLFGWGEGEVSGLILSLEKEKSSENDLKQCFAVINIVFEMMGKASPTKSGIVKQVKNCFTKKSNKNKKKGVNRRGTTVEDIRILVKSLFKKPASKILPQRRRFLLMQLFTFFGMKRFSDISNIQVNDLEFRKDKSLKVKVRKNKTDQLMRGTHFTLSGSKSKGFSLTEIVEWYIDSLGLREEDFLFPRFRKGKGTE